MSEHIKTEYEIAVEFDDLKIKGDKKWISLYVSLVIARWECLFVYIYKTG